MRGKLDRRITVSGLARITPAHAGKTCLRREIHAFRWDHPRRCGENSMSLSSRTTKVGSPPQVRGKLFRSASLRARFGITPAGAGKTIRFAISPAMRVGSPPQVRGKPALYTAPLPRCGITPAGAGKTKTDINADMNYRDHPRRCGENLVKL